MQFEYLEGYKEYSRNSHKISIW